MLTGVEVLALHPEEVDLIALRTAQPSIVKTRSPEVLAFLADRVPGLWCRFLARSMGEGDEPSDVENSFQHWLTTLTRYSNRVVAYEIANEPNAPQYRRDPQTWVQGVSTLRLSTQAPVPLCTPGLVPHVDVQDWYQALAQLGYPYRGIHVYWQQDGPVQALTDAIPPDIDCSRVLITEFNSADRSTAYLPSIQERAEECTVFVQAAAAQNVAGAILFCLGGWSGSRSGWSYAYAPKVTQQILTVPDANRDTVPDGNPDAEEEASPDDA